MINGFPEETKPLTEYEQNILLPVLVSGLKHRVGKAKFTTSRVIINACKKRGMVIDGARVRKLINHIRTHDLVPCLIADSKGYWIEYNTTRLKKYIQSLKQREDAIREVRNALIKQAKI